MTIGMLTIFLDLIALLFLYGKDNWRFRYKNIALGLLGGVLFIGVMLPIISAWSFVWDVWEERLWIILRKLKKKL